MNCNHDIGQRMIEHEGISHPSGFQYCFNCGKTLNQIINEAREEAIRSVLKEIKEYINNKSLLSDEDKAEITGYLSGVEVRNQKVEQKKSGE